MFFKLRFFKKKFNYMYYYYLFSFFYSVLVQSFPLTLNFLSIMGNEFNEVGILALFYLDFENAGFYR